MRRVAVDEDDRRPVALDPAVEGADAVDVRSPPPRPPPSARKISSARWRDRALEAASAGAARAERGCARSATGCASSTAARSTIRTATRSPSSCARSSPRTPTTATATSPTSACATALPTWVDVRDAPVEVVEEAIRPGGLAPTKAPRIQEVLRELPTQATGDEPTLDWLADADRDEAIDFLVELPGVGRKTAACVMIFALGRPEIPVDTHVYRVGGRLGLFPRTPRSSAPTTRCSRSPTPRTPTSCTST